MGSVGKMNVDAAASSAHGRLTCAAGLACAALLGCCLLPWPGWRGMPDVAAAACGGTHADMHRLCDDSMVRVYSMVWCIHASAAAGGTPMAPQMLKMGGPVVQVRQSEQQITLKAGSLQRL